MAYKIIGGVILTYLTNRDPILRGEPDFDFTKPMGLPTGSEKGSLL